MIPRRCRCGVARAELCPDRYHPGHYPDGPPVAPLLGILLAVLLVIGAGATGVAWLLEWL